MANDVLMPKMGYDMEEGKILRWLKQEGDPVTKGEPIAEIETDKIAIEIEAFSSGVLTKILVPAGEMAPVGSPIGLIGEPGEKAPAKAAPVKKVGAGEGAEAAPAKPAAATPATEMAAPEGPRKGPGGSEPFRAPLPGAKPAPAHAAEPGARIKASPLARKVAADKGVSLDSLHGSGPGGRIVRKDVEAAQGQGAAPQRAAAATPGGGRRVPLSGMRKAIARRMVESMAPIPHFFVTMAVDMDRAMALRTEINEGLEKDAKISVNDLVVKACALALVKHPSLNAQWQGDAVFYPDDVAISVAVAIDDGLIAPDIHEAATKSIGTIAREVKDKAGRAKAGKLTPDEYGRGTFTVSNLGMMGVDAFTAIVTPPQSAAIAVGAVIKTPVVKNDQVVVGQIMRFTVSADHRVTDGAGSAAFAAEVRRLLENPLQLLL